MVCLVCFIQFSISLAARGGWVARDQRADHRIDKVDEVRRVLGPVVDRVRAEVRVPPVLLLRRHIKVDSLGLVGLVGLDERIWEAG